MAATLTFDDEFNNGLSLYSSTTGKGTWDTTYWWADGTNSNGDTLTGNSEKEWYINSDYAGTSSVKPWTVNNGTLTLQAAPASSSISSQINNYKYTSGMLNTYHSLSQTYGYFEVRAELPAGQGLWPAFWLMPEDGSWPPELDTMEVLGNDPTKLYTTVHSTSLSGGQESVNGGTTVANTSTGYHTYGVDWEKDHITWYMDGKEIYQVATPADMNKPMYMILNLAVGGSWPGDPDSSTQFPADMNVDWVRAYSSNPYSSATPDSDNPSVIGDASTAAGSGSSTAAAAPAATTYAGTSAADTLTAADNQSNIVNGADGNDSISGGNGFNVINGNAGEDTIVGHSTVGDWLYGGQGNDVIDISASSGHNIVYGNLGNDSIVGGSGFNIINGNQGDDTIVGHSTVGDWLYGGQGNDLIDVSHSTGNNLVMGNLGNDTLVGGAGADTLRGGQGDDSITAGSGKDWISGDLGNNTISGGSGNDTFHAGGGHDLVMNWHNGDHVQIDNGLTYNVTQSGADVHVDLSNGGEMVLQNVTQSSLQSGWLFQA